MELLVVVLTNSIARSDLQGLHTGTPLHMVVDQSSAGHMSNDEHFVGKLFEVNLLGVL